MELTSTGIGDKAEIGPRNQALTSDVLRLFLNLEITDALIHESRTLQVARAVARPARVAGGGCLRADFKGKYAR